jgi:hypothetical protein
VLTAFGQESVDVEEIKLSATFCSHSSCNFLQVCETIEKELGKSPSELFTDFDKTALATASVSSPRTITAEMSFTEVDNPWVRIWIIHYSSNIIY